MLLGASLTVIAALLLVATALLLGPRVAEFVVVALLGLEGALLGAGALLVVGEAGPWDWVVALPVAAVATAAHVRYLFVARWRGRPAG